MATFYNVLEVDRDATIDEIKKAYRALQIKHHPDKTGSLPEEEQASSATLSKAANVAYEVLSDPTLRAAYDCALLKSIHEPGSGEPSDTNWTAWGDRNAPTSPHSPPPQPQRLDVTDRGWAFAIHIGDTYEPYNWGSGLVFAEDYKVLIFLKVHKRPTYAFEDTPDVRLAVASTPQNCSIRKIESLRRHRMTPVGPEEQLLVTIFTSRRAEGGLAAQMKGDPSCFNFAWQLDPPDLKSFFKPPEDVQTYGSCLIFMAKPPHCAALFNSEPCHPDNPRYILLHDKDMQSQNGEPCELSEMRRAWDSHECSWARSKKVAWDRDGERMHRIAAFGWQARGMGKGEEDAS